MISVRNHLPLLSGNKWLFFAGLAWLALGCSPKVRPVANSAKPAAPVTKKEPETAAEKPEATKVSTIAMLLPFSLDNMNPGGQYSAGTLSRANLSLDYYQGFKLALDSLTGKGYNFKLQVFDTKDQTSEASALAYNPAIRTSGLIIGPVFPEDIHAFLSVLSGTGKSIPTVSPLSPASPLAIKDRNLVTVATPLEYHAQAAALYINNHYKPKRVFILRGGSADENNFIMPFKKTLDSLGKGKIKITSSNIVHGQLGGLSSQLSATEENIIVLPATDQAFLTSTLHSLDTLAQKYPITLFGHPSWAKFTYLKPEILQRLKTHITSTDRVDYKSPAIIAFIRDYRKIYHSDPTHYAMMGFDEGLYFGQLLGQDGLKKMDKIEFSGLLNNYSFITKPGLGWINTHVNVLRYTNFELKKVE
jgi:hypothetical protein